MFINRFALSMDLQLFAADDGTSGGAGDITPPDTSAGTQKTENKPETPMIPKTRFDEINGKYKDLQSQLDAITKDREQKELDEKKQKGEFEKLYNSTQKDLESFKGQAEQHSTRVSQLESLLGEMLNTKLEGVPEAMRDLIPENLAPEQKLAWIEKAQAKGIFGNGKSPDTPVGGSTNPPRTEVPADPATLSPLQLIKAGYGSKR